MDTQMLTVSLVILFLLGWVLIYFVNFKIFKIKISKTIEENKKLKTEIDLHKNFDEKYQNLLDEKFKNLVNDKLNEARINFSNSNHSDMEKLIKPFQDKIESFEKNINLNRQNAIKDMTQMQEQFKRLESVGLKTDNLVNALTSQHKLQGNLGEITLEYVLDNCGLQKNIHYESQIGVNVDGKRGILDSIVKMPLGGKIIIDSKYSFNPFINYMNATDEQQKKLYLEELIATTKNRINELSEKEYYKANDIKSEDFVFMFAPNDTIFNILVSGDVRTTKDKTNIYDYAFKKNVIIIGPFTLLATLKTLSRMYREIDVSKNAYEISLEAGKMYEKFKGFLKNMNETKNNIQKTLESHDEACRKLESGPGNLISKAEKIKNLGARTEKNIG